MHLALYWYESYLLIIKMKASISSRSKSYRPFCDIFQLILQLKLKYQIKIIEIKCIRLSKVVLDWFWIHSKDSEWKINSAKHPFLILNFCSFKDHKWKALRVTMFKFSKKWLNIVSNECEKSYKPNLSHFCATPFWKCVPVLM